MTYSLTQYLWGFFQFSKVAMLRDGTLGSNYGIPSHVRKMNKFALP